MCHSVICYTVPMSPISITKADGSKELFNSEKLERSLRRAGASEAVAQKVVEHVAEELVNGMSTGAIYEHAFANLRKMSHPVVPRYSLKRALADLGPSGFPFEKFIAELFKAQGFEAVTNQTLKGKCIEHEVDVVAWNEKKLVMVEAKFHNELGLKSDLKVALYVKARFDDLRAQDFSFGGSTRRLDEGMLITNTKFTENAMKYAACAGVTTVGWNAPEEGNLFDLITTEKLHPLTALTSLGTREKQELLASGIVLCKTLKDKEFLRPLGLSEEKMKQVVDEINSIC